MSTLASIQRPSQPAPLSASRTGFAPAALSGWMPLQFSIVTVFLFAGPHNWLEFRYFLTRMPARWGRLRTFFLVAFVGMTLLTTGFAAFFFLTAGGLVGLDLWVRLYPLWATGLILWV